MSFLIVSPGRDPQPWVEALRNQHPGLNIYVYPEDHDKEEVEFALAWNHPRGLFKNYPNLKVVASMGAGVDHITSDKELPENITITRVIDEQLTTDMSDFVLAQVMDHVRRLSYYKSQQTEKTWIRKPYKRPKNTIVGIMGIGVLGTAVGEKLAKNGFKVLGWSKSSKDKEDINTYYGEEGFEEFLPQAEILVCLLPLTTETENILNRELFEQLPEGAYVINVARGEHLVEQDLLRMIGSGHLSGAALDVFREEPLPEEHPFWTEPKIHITPHIASVTKASSVVPQIIENYEHLQEDEPLNNVVERDKGY
ncbi:glyoxylate/hydroxypyruvate reductase A [Salegentibacter sp. F188]|uniref:Glyoxylate/hydroxypyruvate reductase A n=1 Tax=Autumnicola patrickiae TaxID=3075591 RepID=A0ABU3DZT6_9FLAO|nr:glyoxylate/hydroxypyruvate reductase A [Salegentibacter sp. F188]MDT0689143.1 glyoxylate/hydroxypyruvate reductase A [Salegentibacter sp. F188]